MLSKVHIRPRPTYLALGIFLLLILTSLGVLVRSVPAQGIPPVFELHFLGNGSPTAINNQRTVIGTRTIAGNYQPLVSTNSEAWTVLPVPPGSMSTFPTDINDLGVIVGVSFSPQWNPTGVRWTIGTNGYALEVLPLPPGDTSAFPTGINDLGQIIGSRSSLGYVPTGTGWVFSDQAGFTRLTDFDFWIVPRDINNSGLIIGGQERLNLATGQVDVTGEGPPNYQPIASAAINSSGMMVGSSPLRSTSLNVVSVFKYLPESGWAFIAGSSRYTVAYDINDNGDIGYGELGAGLHLTGLGNFSVSSLLSPETVGNGWIITGNGAFLNNSREVATVGRNTVTGENGAVLLLPVGNVPAPTAPTDLAGVPHPATRMEPFNSVELTWVNTSPLTRGWELQRSVAGSSTWEILSLVPPGTTPQHSDTTVGVNVTYNYRVRATGLGGPSPWSNIAVATSPATPLDTTPPVVTLLEPTDGATVSGLVAVRSTATDNVEIEYQEISFWNQFTGQQVIIGSSGAGGEISFTWDTRQLTAGTYTVRAFAYDTLGNFSQNEANVNIVSETGGILRVSSLALTSIRLKTGIWVIGYARVLDAAGNAVPDATVSVTWRTPNGRWVFQTSQTNAQGIAALSVLSVPGTYRLTISDVTRKGYELDRANSQLTAKYWRLNAE